MSGVTVAVLVALTLAFVRRRGRLSPRRRRRVPARCAIAVRSSTWPFSSRRALVAGAVVLLVSGWLVPAAVVGGAHSGRPRVGWAVVVA